MKKLMTYLLIVATAFLLTAGSASQSCYAEDGGDYVEDPNEVEVEE